MKRLWIILIFLLFLGFATVVNILIHEFGHCLTIEAVGGKCESIHVGPGLQVWPLSAFGRSDSGQWDGFIAYTSYSQVAATDRANGLTSLMGSGSVALLSLLSLLGLYAFDPRGWLRFPLLAQSLMFLDLLFYTILPHWFGLRHMFFIGGDDPEPLLGAIRMGIPEGTFIAAVLIFSAGMTIGCVGYVWKSTKRRA